MVVHDFDLAGISIPPGETDPPLIVDADAVPPFQIAFEGFEAISRRDSQILQGMGIVYHPEFTSGRLLNIAWQATRHFAFPDLFRFLACETFDHSIPPPVI